MRWGSTMKARKLIDGADFGRYSKHALKVNGKAFYFDAWLKIAANFGTDPLQIETSASPGLRKPSFPLHTKTAADAEVLKRAALQRMALDYRDN